MVGRLGASLLGAALWLQPVPLPAAPPASAPAEGPPPGPAAEAPPAAPITRLDLAQALGSALATSPDLRAAESRLRQAAVVTDLQRQPLNPTLTGTASSQQTFLPVAQPAPLPFNQLLNALDPRLRLPASAPPPSPVSAQLQVVLSQTLDLFGRVHWNAQAAELSRRQAAQSLRGTLEALLQATESAYIQVAQAAAQEAIARSTLEANQGFLKTARDLLKGGLVAGFDVQQYLASVEQSEQSLQAQRMNRRQQLVVLRVLTGLPLDDGVTLAPLPVEPPDLEELDRQRALALERRPEVAALRWAVASAEAAVRAAARTSAPTVSLFSQYTYAGTTDQLSQTWLAGARLDLPLLDGDLARLQTRRAEEALEQTRQNLEAQKRTVTQDVSIAYVSLQDLWSQRATALKAVEAAREAQRISTLRYREGVSSSLELLNTQATYNATQSNLVAVEAAYQTAQVNFRRAVSADPPLPLPAPFLLPREAPGSVPVGPTPAGSP